MASSSATLAITLLAVLAIAATAQECAPTRQTWAASLANVSPKGCLKEVLNATQTQGLVTAECFNKLNLNLTNNTGAAGCPARSFNVSFDDTKNCAAGFDNIATGTLAASKKAGEFDASGNFVTETAFKGTLNAKNQLTVTADGAKCELTYALKPVGKAVALSAAEAKAAAATSKNGSAADATPAAGGAAGAPAPAAKKSSAAVSNASVLLGLLCALLAFLL